MIIFFVNAKAQTWECGVNGDNVTATLENGVFTISGVGEMADFNYTPEIPWYNVMSSINSLIIGNEVTTIGNMALYKCTGLTSITIPENITTIGKNSFYGCTELKEVILEEGNITLSLYGTSFNVSTGYTGTFYDCPIETLYYGRTLSVSTHNQNITYLFGRSVKNVTISEVVTSIAWGAFKDCNDLTSITIPSAVTKIGIDAFYYCNNLDTIICNAITPPTLLANAFIGVAKDTKVFVPCHTSDDYENSDWGNCFNNFIEDCTGIDNAYINKVNFYPNPVANTFFVETEDSGVLTLYNILGVEVLNQYINSNKTEISISHLPKGIYIVSILSEGKVITNNKIVKQ